MPQTSLPLGRRLALRAPPLSIPARWLLVPLIAALAAGFLSEWTDIDRVITRLVYDRDAGTFPLHHVFWLDVVMHHWAKYAVATLGFAMLAGLMLSFVLRALAPHRRMLLFIVLAMSLAPLSVTLGKAISTTHCPWDIEEFGGSVPYSTFFARAPPEIKPGHCFPAGHASTGFSLLAFYFAAFAKRCRVARVALIVGLAAGMALGVGRVVQGAHFPSHVLWAGVICWTVMIILYTLILQRRCLLPPHYYCRRRRDRTCFGIIQKAANRAEWAADHLGTHRALTELHLRVLPPHNRRVLCMPFTARLGDVFFGSAFLVTVRGLPSFGLIPFRCPCTTGVLSFGSVSRLVQHGI